MTQLKVTIAALVAIVIDFSCVALGADRGPAGVACTNESKSCSGIYREFYQDGGVRFESQWLVGKPAPKRTETTFFPDGSKSAVKQYQNNLLNGVSVHYSESHEIQEKTHYRDGKKNGPSSTYDDAGKISELTNWLNDEKHGEAVEYGDSGKPVTRIQYIAGMPDGKTTSYFDNGHISRVTEYHLGEKHGVEQEMLQNGKPKSIRHYHRGQLHGIQQDFDAEGSLALETTYKSGKLAGPRKFFGENGMVTQVTIYKDDQPILETDYVDGEVGTTWKIFPDGSRAKTKSPRSKPVSAGPN